jgi:serine O-acetyltransferase
MNNHPVDLPGSASANWELGPVIDALRISRETTHNIRHHARVRELPSREALMQVISGVSAALFPTHYGVPI